MTDVILLDGVFKFRNRPVQSVLDRNLFDELEGVGFGTFFFSFFPYWKHLTGFSSGFCQICVQSVSHMMITYLLMMLWHMLIVLIW